MARGDVLPRRNLPQSAEPWGRKIGERVQDIEAALARAEASIINNNRAQNGLGVVLAGTSNLAEELQLNSEIVAEAMNQVAIDLEENDRLLAENKLILDQANLDIKANADLIAANKVILDQANTKLTQAQADLAQAQTDITANRSTIAANKTILDKTNRDLAAEEVARKNAITSVEQAISDLSGTVEGIDGGPTVSPNEPSGSGKKTGALWYRVDGQKNVVGTWRWTGSVWDPITFGPGSIQASIITDISTAKTQAGQALQGAGNANLAAQTADGKVTWSLSAPVPADGKLSDGRNRAEGSTWYHRDASNNVIGLYRWNGTTAWVSQPLNSGAIANNAITTDKLANAVTTSITQAQTTAGNAQTAATNAATAASEADQKARDAAGLAGTKGKTIFSTSAPTAEDRNAQTLWIDTTGGANTPKRWTSGTTWVAVTDKVAVDAAGAAVTAQGRADAAFTAATNAATAAGNAQTAADGKSTVWYLSTAPAGTGHKVGDTWFDTGNGNRIMRWSGSAWVSALIGNGAISDLAISNAKLADNAVNAAKILNGSVTSDQLSNAVNTSITTAQQTATNAATAAADAKSYANSVLMSAENVIIDGAFSQGQWKSQTGSWILDTSTGRGDSFCLRKNGFASNTSYSLTVDAVGNRVTIPVNPGETWEVSGWYRTSADWNGSTANSKLRLANQDNQPVGPGGAAVVNTGWTQVGGRLTIGSTVTALQLAIAADNTAGAILWDDISLKNVTAAVAAETIAGAAQTAADAAKTAADNAKTIADRAETTANGKNRNIRSTAVASGAGANGDQWWRYSGTQVIGMWIHNGSTWVAQTLTDSVITNLNAGTITSGYIKAALIEANTITGTHIAGATVTAANMVTGTITAASGIIANAAIGNAEIADAAITNAKIKDATIQSAKIGSVDAETITVNKLKGVQIEAGTITGSNIMAGTIGTGKMMIGDFEDLFEDRSLASEGAWTGNFSLIPRSSPNQAANMMVILGGGASVRDVYSTKIVDVLGGEKIAIQGQVYTGTGASGTAWILARVTLASGGYAYPNISKNITSTQGTDTFEGVITLPANAVKVQLALSLRSGFTSGASTNWHSLSAKFQKPGTLIENGAITTEKMIANTIEGDRIKGGTMEADKLVAGSITAAQLAAGSVTTEKLTIGNFDNLIEDPNLTIPLSSDITKSMWNTPEGSLSNWSYQNNASGFNPQRTLRGQAAAGAQRLANRSRITLNPGDRFALSARVNSSLNTNPQMGLVFRSETNGLVGSSIWTIPTPAGTAFDDFNWITDPAPANAAYAQFEIRTSTATTGAANFGNLAVRAAVGQTVIQNGAIGTDQIQANAVVAEKIKANAVTADAIAANAITADKIKANEISSDKIITAGLDAGVIKFGEMSGARIQVNTLSASKLVIGDFTNLVDDPYFELSLGATESEWVRRSGSNAATTIFTTSGLPGPSMTLRGVGTEVSVWTKGTFQVQPGQNYRVDFRVQSQLTGSSPISYVRVYWYQKDMAAASGTQTSIAIPAGTSWTDALGSTVTAPANAARARVMLIHGNNNTGGTWWIGNIAVRRTTGATLIDDNAITTDKLTANAITAAKLAANSVVTDSMVANSINGDRIAVNTLNADRIVANSITADKIKTNAITANELAANSVVTSSMAANTINGDRITGNTLHADKITSRTITTDKIATNQINAGHIIADQINTGHIVSTGLTADAIAANAITADKIRTNAITSEKVQANAIDGMTITGSTFRTAASGTRVQINGTGSQNGLSVYTGTGSNSEVIRLGYGIPTGMEIRHPAMNELIPLADSVFGTKSFTAGASYANYKAFGGSYPAKVVETARTNNSTTNTSLGWSFTALTNRTRVDLTMQAIFGPGSAKAFVTFLHLYYAGATAGTPIIGYNQVQDGMYQYPSLTGFVATVPGRTYTFRFDTITRDAMDGPWTSMSFGADVQQLNAVVTPV